MNLLWLLRGSHDAPGWGPLEKDSKANKVELVLFDRDAWALIRAAEAPTQYEGLVPGEPKDGMYVSHQGYPIYVVNRREVMAPYEVVQALGQKAEAMLKQIGDPDTVLQRMGRAF